MRVRWYVAAAAVATMVVAVLAVRPGSRVPQADLAAATVRTTDRATGPATGPAGPVRGPDAFPGASVTSFDVSGGGIGPLRLGEQQAALADAGWTFAYDEPGCVRLVPTSVGEVVLSGWVVDGRLVSAQLETADVLGRTGPTSAGFTFGRPVDEVDDGFDRQLLVAGAGLPEGGTEVRSASSVVDGATVLVSDLGTYGVRLAEVREAGAPDCVVTAPGSAAIGQATVRATGYDYLDRLAPGTVGPLLDLVGTGEEQLRAPGSPWRGTPVDPLADGCGVLRSVTPTGTAELFRRDGTVVGQRYVAAGFEASARGPAWLPASEAFVAEGGVLVQRPVLGFSRPAGDGSADGDRATGYLGYTAELAAGLDTAVVVEGPTILEESAGDLCGTPGR